MNRKEMMGLWALTVLFGMAVSLPAQEPEEVPKSYGEASKVDTPILRVPLLAKPPTIDGIMSPGEWDDAAALSGFWYDFGFGTFRHMAPPQTQLQVYSGYDKEFLYFCWSSPIYPVDSWLRARGRFPDTLMHPLYGMLFDDHTELEIRPLEDLAEGFSRGLLRWDVNPIGTITDWHWSPQTGDDMRYNPRAEIRTVADGRRWVIEYKIPLKSLRHAGYDAKDENGRPRVAIPSPDGSAFRVWFARGIGGHSTFFNAFDAHGWNTTKMKLVFDSKSPVFQINEIGPLMDSVLNMQMTVKNHNTRSETVRLGFHIETDGETTYSTYQSKETPNGLLELRPGETRVLKLRRPLPGLTAGNVLWFDVRSAGQPAKTLFLTRLINFHLMDSSVKVAGKSGTFRELRVDAIEKLRPPRNPDFDLRVDISPYTKRLSAVVDRGILGVRPEVKTAVEAQLIVKKTLGGEQPEIHEFKTNMVGDFATFLCDAPDLEAGESYQVTVLLFDENMKIVAEQTETKPFINLTAGKTEAKAISGEQVELHPWEKAKTSDERPSTAFMDDERVDRRESFQTAPWMGNALGREDRVWEPFTPIQPNDKGFDTLKHRFTLDASGLPAQIDIRPDPRELPLEQRGANAVVSPQTLLAIGRGPQLRAPFRLEAVVGGARVPAQVLTPAKAVRTGKSEIEYASKLRIGPVEADLRTRYDCDGSLHATLVYGSGTPVKIDRLQMVADIAGTVDLAVFDNRLEYTLPKKTGVVWDSTAMHMELFFTKFVPWFWFGNDDRGWSYVANNDKGWILDRDGSAMEIERDKVGDVTWRVAFVNHPAEVRGPRTIEFSILTHPAKPKPENARLMAWQYNCGEEYQANNVLHYRGWSAAADVKTSGNAGGDCPYAPSDKELQAAWRSAAGAPANIPYEKCAEWRKDKPPYFRYFFHGDLDLPEQNRLFEDKALFYFERLVRMGRMVGWYLTLTPSSASQNAAMEDAWLRPLATVRTNELPWHPGFLSLNQRNMYKRLARVHAENNVPPRHQTQSGKAASLLESFMWNSLIWGEDGASMRAYEIDLLTSFPNSYYRFAAMNYTGLSTTLVPDINPVGSGDNPCLDRQMLGVALLHDFGVTRGGGVNQGAGISWVPMEHEEQAVRLLGRLGKFGFFDDAATEKLPFWRNDAQVRMGDKPGDESKVRVTVYRRPLDNGKGYKAIFVILNESDGDVELPLDLRDPKRILGGASTLRRGDVLGSAAVPAALQQAWRAADGRAADEPALMDLETGKLIAKAGDKAGERYGPVFVPYHDYRVLYGECDQKGEGK